MPTTSSLSFAIYRSASPIDAAVFGFVTPPPDQMYVWHHPAASHRILTGSPVADDLQRDGWTAQTAQRISVDDVSEVVEVFAVSGVTPARFAACCVN